MSTNTLSIVIPAHNEEAGLGAVLEGLADADLPGLLEILVVDDGSEDTTGAVAESACQRLPVKVIRHSVNRGYGASLKTGIRAAQGEIVLMMDADGQHSPEDAKNIIHALASDDDMVVGLRGSGSARDAWRKPGKWVLGKLANYLSRTHIPDLNSGLRAVRRTVISKYLHLLPDGYSASTTSTMALIKRGYAIRWEPITALPRAGGASSVRQMHDGLGVILLMIRLIALFDPLRVFLPTGALFFTGGVISGIYYFFYGSFGGGVSVGSLLLLLTGLLLFFFGIVADQISALRLEKYE
ncbi:MAG: glycosyltransferase family 2 protein [Candidatus Latescibacteria bacterium]|jgi:glycosyltransferase involved in cell wall biosynthesis|nr:glycosyltransferase family 2 protein [Candidatus Latescibacterota bacterium]